MAELKFTPGPWCVGNTMRGGSRTMPRFEAYVHVGEQSDRGNCIAVVHMGGSGAIHNDEHSVEANAHLIAAAPEMYEALAQLLQVDDDWHGSINSEMATARNAARAALAKARGEAQ